MARGSHVPNMSEAASTMITQDGFWFFQYIYEIFSALKVFQISLHTIDTTANSITAPLCAYYVCEVPFASPPNLYLLLC